MIRIKDLHKNYGSVDALQNVSLEIEKGSITYLIGPNASGKTTLIKLILGLIKPTKGEIIVNGITLNGDYKYREIIGYMPQVANFPDNLIVKEIFNMLKELRNNNSDLDEELIEKFGLEKEFDKQIKNLSGGTRQKLNASIAFMFNPEILILDEPTAGLDPLSCSILKEKIKRENQNGKTIIFTSHILSELEELATNFVFLLDGKIVFSKKKEEMQKSNIEDVIITFMKGINGEHINQNN
ncbi:MAG: ABC transporter ATP-binding protein [Melioribacter sp.]|uniref:ABC transporter ATP-binding protein n=1 Tax=Rosettibacter primus TaxID=3111523 RepID=UPI00247DFEB7|nr:ABC transporter ATP-binding protein [Melioribacter sp.]